MSVGLLMVALGHIPGSQANAQSAVFPVPNIRDASRIAAEDPAGGLRAIDRSLQANQSIDLYVLKAEVLNDLPVDAEAARTESIAFANELLRKNSLSQLCVTDPSTSCPEEAFGVYFTVGNLLLEHGTSVSNATERDQALGLAASMFDRAHEIFPSDIRATTGRYVVEGHRKNFIGQIDLISAYLASPEPVSERIQVQLLTDWYGALLNYSRIGPQGLTPQEVQKIQAEPQSRSQWARFYNVLARSPYAIRNSQADSTQGFRDVMEFFGNAALTPAQEKL
jgi:hypothetical protein